MRKPILIAALALLLVLFIRLMGGHRAASITFDEGLHLVTGYVNVKTGDLRLEPLHGHPPLAIEMSAGPLLLLPDIPDPRALDGWMPPSQSALAEALIWQYPRQESLLLLGRLTNMLLTLLLAALVFRWSCDLFGPGAGLLALTLFTLDPNIAAHGILATTDLPVTFWGFLTLFLAYRARTGKHRLWVACGAALGAALASKLSAVLLAPVVAIVLVITLVPRRGWDALLKTGVGMGFTTFFIVWASYGFEVRALPGWPFPIPAATHVVLYGLLQNVNTSAPPAYLLGQVGDGGWLTYFPIAFAIKTPLPTLILTSIGLGLAIWQKPHRWRNELGLILFPLFYTATALTTHINLGYRHLLPLLPFLYVLAGRTLLLYRYRVARLLLWGVMLWLGLTAAFIYPHHLAYFNELVGGPANGHRYLVDSNLDWGQWLKTLHDYTEREGIEYMYISQFSPSEPARYELNYDFIPPSPRALAFTPYDPAPGVYAIGATTLEGVYTPDVNTFAWFRTRQPIAQPGYAVFVYRVPERAPAQWAVLCDAPQPPLSADAVRTHLGQPALRVLHPDCEAAWVYPAALPGVIVTPAERPPPPDGVLDVQARTAAGKPHYALYRVEALPAYQTTDRAILAGPLQLLGFNLIDSAAQPGQTIELQNIWRIHAIPERPLSLMAHLAAADGRVIAVGDGLGFPREQWAVGDVIIQRHYLTLPEDAPAGTYHILIGAYWLDTLERWPIQSGDAADSLEFAITEIVIP